MSLPPRAAVPGPRRGDLGPHGAGGGKPDRAAAAVRLGGDADPWPNAAAHAVPPGLSRHGAARHRRQQNVRIHQRKVRDNHVAMTFMLLTRVVLDWSLSAWLDSDSCDSII